MFPNRERVNRHQDKQVSEEGICYDRYFKICRTLLRRMFVGSPFNDGGSVKLKIFGIMKCKIRLSQTPQNWFNQIRETSELL